LGGQIEVKRENALMTSFRNRDDEIAREVRRQGLDYSPGGSKIALLFWAVAKQPAKAARKQPVGERLNFAGPQDGRLRVNRRPFAAWSFEGVCILGPVDFVKNLLSRDGARAAEVTCVLRLP